jgi:hypothetical protein
MNGWSIIFGSVSVGSAVWGSPAFSEAARFCAVLFGVLFLLTLFTRAIRGTAC